MTKDKHHSGELFKASASLTNLSSLQGGRGKDLNRTHESHEGLTTAGEVLVGMGIKPLSPTQLRLIEASENADPQAILFQHTVFCQAGLPYRDPGKDVQRWEVDNGNISLLVTAKDVRDPKTNKWVKLGIPFGPKARLFLADTNSQAILKQSPEIDLEASLTRYVKRLEIDPCGRNIRSVKEIISRTCSAQIQIAVPFQGKMHQLDTQLMTEFEIWFPKDERQRVLWPSVAWLSRDYFETLLRHGVPLDEAHYVALSHSAMAMDIYAWLAQRLHRIKVQSVDVSWSQLRLQFGWHYQELFKFRQVFKIALKQVLNVYKVAKVEVDHKGLTLRNSPPPVLKTQIRVP